LLYQDHVLPAHYGLTVSGDTSIAREFEDLAKDPEKYAAEQEAHNRAKTQRPLADFAAGGDRLNPQLIKRMSRKMPGEYLQTPSLDELMRQMRQLRQVRAEPESAAGCASRTTDPAGGPNTLAAMSGMFFDTGNERLVPGLVPGASLPTPAPSRRNMAAGLPVGILLYIVCVGLVAIATIGVFFGIGFFLLAQPTEELIAAAAPLPPVSSLAQRPAVGEAVPQQESNSARVSAPMSPDGEASATAARDAAPSGEVLALRSTSGEKTIIAPAQTASAPEPEPNSPASPAPPPAQASPRVLAEIAEFFAAQRAPAADEVITFEQYRDFRIHDLTQRRARLAQQPAAPNLSAAEKKRLERQMTYYDWLAAMPAEELDRHFRERFDEIDANHDGKLDPEERAVWREKQREYYQQQATERAVRFHPR
jgi:hypothetical protein